MGFNSNHVKNIFIFLKKKYKHEVNTATWFTEHSMTQLTLQEQGDDDFER